MALNPKQMARLEILKRMSSTGAPNPATAPNNPLSQLMNQSVQRLNPPAPLQPMKPAMPLGPSMKPMSGIKSKLTPMKSGFPSSAKRKPKFL